MRVSELTVYDWFFVEGEVQQVMPSLIDYVFYGQPVNIEPIPLTAETLLANGFQKNGYYYRMIYNSTDFDNHSEFLFRLDFHYLDAKRMKNRAWEAKVYATIDYVHELQHALRLMGLDDLADDFKIQ